jgi:hypothetical protein
MFQVLLLKTPALSSDARDYSKGIGERRLVALAQPIGGTVEARVVDDIGKAPLPGVSET